MAIELYKALTFISFFIGLAFGLLAGMITRKAGEGASFSMLMDKIGNPFLIVCLLVIITAITLFMAEFIPKYYYGKHLKQVKDIIDQLDEE